MTAKDLPNKIKDLSIEVSTSAIKVQLSMIPIVGEILKEIIYDIPQGRKIERLAVMLEELKDQIARQKISASEEYVRSEDFFDLVSQAVEKSIRTKNRTKIKAFASIVALGITERKSPEDVLVNVYLRALDELTDSHFKLLIFISNNLKELTEIGTYPKYHDFLEKEREWNIDKYEFKLLNEDLKRWNFISDGAGLNDYHDSSEYMATEADRPASIVITSVGEKFISLIRKVSDQKLG